ncbi:MAG: hypothetical protein OES25_16880 [Acidobacteriota bacterium]|nr:hypothetical protein [Acidobacteriota bacterium]
MKAQYGVAIDQYGQRFYFGEHCRKDLMDQIGRKRAAKMYIDKKDGSTVQIGYIIGGHWLTVYAPVEVPQ